MFVSVMRLRHIMRQTDILLRKLLSWLGRNRWNREAWNAEHYDGALKGDERKYSVVFRTIEKLLGDGMPRICVSGLILSSDCRGRKMSVLWKIKRRYESFAQGCMFKKILVLPVYKVPWLPLYPWQLLRKKFTDLWYNGCWKYPNCHSWLEWPV